jgi:hypothetical protein
MVFFPIGATSPWKVAECILLLLTLLIVLLLGGAKLRRQMIRLLIQHLKLEQLSKWISSKYEKQERICIIVERLSFKKLLSLIEEQTSYIFFYEEEVLKQAKPVTIRKKDVTVEEILNLALAFQPKSFSYSINGKMVFLRRTPRKWRRQLKKDD